MAILLENQPQCSLEMVAIAQDLNSPSQVIIDPVLLRWYQSSSEFGPIDRNSPSNKPSSTSCFLWLNRGLSLVRPSLIYGARPIDSSCLLCLGGSSGIYMIVFVPSSFTRYLYWFTISSCCDLSRDVCCIIADSLRVWHSTGGDYMLLDHMHFRTRKPKTSFWHVLCRFPTRKLLGSWSLGTGSVDWRKNSKSRHVCCIQRRECRVSDVWLILVDR